MKDENNYCIDIHDVSNHSLVIPLSFFPSFTVSTIACSRVIITLHWVERKSAKDRDRNAAPSRTQSKHYNYMVAIGDEEMGSNTLSVRSRGSKEGKSMAISEFSKELEAELRSLNEK